MSMTRATGSFAAEHAVLCAQIPDRASKKCSAPIHALAPLMWRRNDAYASLYGRTLLGAANAGGIAPKYKRQPLFSKRRASRRAIFLTTVAVYAVVISKHLLGSATMPGMFQRPDGPCHFAKKDAPLILFAIPRRLTSPRQRAGSCV